MARSADLGVERHVDLPHGRLVYHELGVGPAVLFVHGLLVNADLWRGVAPGVSSAGHRCIVPDLPLGAHTVPLAPGADLSPVGVAQLLHDLIVALDLDDVTIVANDTGGAVVQVLMARHPERIGRVVLTSSDSLERFFPPLFRFLQWMGWIPGGTWLVARLSAVRSLQRLPLTFGWLTMHPFPADLHASFSAPSRSAAIRRDLRSFLREAHRRHTLEAARHLPRFERPVLLAWARRDRLFPVSLARRLQALLPDARLELIDDSYTFVPLDQPEALTEHIIRFAAPRETAR